LFAIIIGKFTKIAKSLIKRQNFVANFFCGSSKELKTFHYLQDGEELKRS